MKRHTKIALVAISIVTIATTTVVVAGGRHGNMGEHMISKISDRLDLNDQQASALESLHSELRETRELMRGNADSDAKTLADLISADTFDQGAALELITARTSALQAQGPELVAAAALFFDGLDAEQKASLNEHVSKFAKRRNRSH